MTERRPVIGLAHGSIILGRDEVGDTLVALDKRLIINLRGESLVRYLIEIKDVQSVATHAHMIHSHELKHTHAPLGLRHHLGRNLVDVALAQTGIAHEMLHVSAALKACGRNKHRKLFGLEFLELLRRQIGLQGLAIVDSALTQHLVVPDFVIDFTKRDIAVHQCTETTGIHG